MNNDLPSPAGAPASSLAARLMNVFVTPGDVFAEIKDSPVRHVNWYVPALLFLLASWCAAGLMFSQDSIRHQLADAQDQAFQKQFQKQIDAGTITQAQVDQMKSEIGRFTGIGTVAGFVVGPAFLAGITPFWGGFIIWIGAAWIFKRPVGFLKAVEVVGLAMVIEAVGALVKGLLCAGMGSLFAAPGPILLVKNYDPSNLAHNLLLMLDLFLLWSLAVRSIGFARLCGISLAKALLWILGVWSVISGSIMTLSWGVQKMTALASGQ